MSYISQNTFDYINSATQAPVNQKTKVGNFLEDAFGVVTDSLGNVLNKTLKNVELPKVKTESSISGNTMLFIGLAILALIFSRN